MTIMTETLNELIRQLDSCDRKKRLAALESLCDRQRLGLLDDAVPAGPVLPSYDHVHTTVSYGFAVPGVHSVSRMVWAAHEAHSDSTLIVEHESVAHFAEAEQAVAIVNRGIANPLRLILGVEFKTPIALNDMESRFFSRDIAREWGQGEAAWIVGIGATPSDELSQLAAQFQKAKRLRARQKLQQLNRHLALTPPLSLSQLLTPEGNITDRTLCSAVADARWPDANAAAQAKHRSDVRAMLNPGSPGYVVYPPGLPSYQDLIGKLSRLGMTPTFTTQLRGQQLAKALPLLKSWGIGALDIAGIEPDDTNSHRAIWKIIQLAEQNRLALVGGSDYRGAGTGWTEHATWMDCPLIRTTIDRLAALDQSSPDRCK